TPLLFAARAGDIKSADLLLAAGAKIEDADGDHNTPLVVASEVGNVPMVDFLLQKGANVNADGGGFTALHWAAGWWETGFTSTLKSKDSAWSRISGLKGDAKFNFVKLLVDHGANVNAVMRAEPRVAIQVGGEINYPLVGATPLLLAAGGGNVKIMHLLLDH